MIVETVVVQIANNRAFSILENLEALHVIKVLKRFPYPQHKETLRTINEYPDRAARLSEIKSITKNIHIDLTNFHFNRDEANDYDS